MKLRANVPISCLRSIREELALLLEPGVAGLLLLLEGVERDG